MEQGDSWKGSELFYIHVRVQADQAKAAQCFGLETASVLFGNRVTFICVYLPCQVIPERLLKGFVLKSSDSGFFY